jgi:type II secretory pathway component GspD/PulD (secretin)
VFSDRVDAGGAARIRRSPPAEQKRRLSVTPVPGGAAAGRLRVDALHTPLADLLAAVSGAAASAANVPLVAAPDAADLDVSLVLPSATPAELVRALSVGYGLTVTPRDIGEGGGFALARGGAPETLTRLPLRHLTPEAARLLFPDFLLSRLRADAENNALVVSGPPLLAERLKADLATLDRPRPQVRVEVAAYEFADAEDARVALRAAWASGRESAAVDTGAGQVSVRVEAGQRRAFTATVEALAARGRARLVARPFVVVASGAEGTLFFGQSRFVTVLRGSFGGLQAQALRLPIGTTLTVSPRVGADGDVTLDLAPRISTVDAVEARTGLPTLGIREMTATVRVRPGDAVVVAGLEADLSAETRVRTLTLPAARRADRARTSLVLLVTAQES